MTFFSLLLRYCSFDFVIFSRRSFNKGVNKGSNCYYWGHNNLYQLTFSNGETPWWEEGFHADTFLIENSLHIQSVKCVYSFIFNMKNQKKNVLES